MSDYGPPTDDQIRQYHGSQARVANWVQNHSAPTSPVNSPPSTRSNSYSSSRTSSRSSLPPPPPGFKYAPANTPVVFKTQAATYTVVHPGSKPGYSDHASARSSSRPSSTPPRRTQTYPVVYQAPYQTYQTQAPAPFYYQAAPRSKPKEKEQPLLRRLFGVGDGGHKKPEPPRRHSSGSSGTNITIQW